MASGNGKVHNPKFIVNGFIPPGSTAAIDRISGDCADSSDSVTSEDDYTSNPETSESDYTSEDDSEDYGYTQVTAGRFLLHLDYHTCTTLNIALYLFDSCLSNKCLKVVI